jgi:hypothetical protein
MNPEYQQYLNSMPNQLKSTYNSMDPTLNFAAAGSFSTQFAQGNFEPNKLHNMFQSANSGNSFNYFNPNVPQNGSNSNYPQYNYGQYQQNTNMYNSNQSKNESFSANYIAGFGAGAGQSHKQMDPSKFLANDAIKYPTAQVPAQPPHVLKRSKKEFFEGGNSSKKISSPLMSSLAPKLVNSRSTPNTTMADSITDNTNLKIMQTEKFQNESTNTAKLERMERMQPGTTGSSTQKKPASSILSAAQVAPTQINKETIAAAPAQNTNSNVALKKLIHQIKTIIKSE